MESFTRPTSACPNCGGADFVTEPVMDEDELPTGLLAIYCNSCGHAVGEIPQGAPTLQADPDLDAGLLPTADEEPPELWHPYQAA